MYENSGARIKTFAKTMATLEIIFCVIVGLILFSVSIASDNSRFNPEWFSWVCLAASLVIGVGGSMFAWFKFLFLAGYGELIEETAKSSEYLKDIRNSLIKNTEKEMDEEFCLNSQPSPKKADCICAFCGNTTDVLISRLCNDCNELLNKGTIVECPNCSRYHNKDVKCKCQLW